VGNQVYFDFVEEFWVAGCVDGAGEHFGFVSEFLQFNRQSEDLPFAAGVSPKRSVNHGNSHGSLVPQTRSNFELSFIYIWPTQE